MADRSVAPGSFASVYSQALSGDRLLLQPGLHNLGTSRFAFGKSNITVEAASGFTAGQWVTGANGHNIANVPVRVRGMIDVTGSNNIFRGFGWYDSSASGPGTSLVLGSNNTFEDLVLRNRFTTAFVDGGVSTTTAGTIFFTIGGPTRPSGNVFRRLRFRLCGDTNANMHDHPFYIKNCTGTLIEDCISYEQTDGWMFHFYPNGDFTTVRRCVGYSVAGGVTWSGANDSSTGLSGCLASDNNVLENCILMKGNTRWLVESYWGCATIGTNNVIRNSDVYQPGGSTGSGRISTSNGGFSQANILNADPLFADAANGDFTLSASSPAVGMGPTQIQPGGAPQPPPPNVTGFTATAATSPTRVNLAWTNPASMSGRSVYIFRSTSAFITSPAGQTPITTTTSTSYSDTGASTADTTYYYSAFVVEGGLFSSGAYDSDVTGAGTPPPPPTDPTGGNEYVGKITVGTVWRDMSGDYKRASRFQVPTGKQITSLKVYLRGNGTSGTQDVRPFVYDDTTGALLGTFTAQSISNTRAEGWVEFTPSSAIVCPTNGGTIRLGMHTTSGSVQVAADVVAGALFHGSDTYSDGTESTWTGPLSDTYELSIFAFTEDVAVSGDLSAASTWTWSSAGNAVETGGGAPSAIPASDVVYRLDTAVITYQIPTPYQVSTGAKLRWDGTQFIYAEG